jgi:hypothetical protein
MPAASYESPSYNVGNKKYIAISDSESEAYVAPKKSKKKAKRVKR